MKTNIIHIAVMCTLLAGAGSALADPPAAAYADISAGAAAKPLDSTWPIAADGRIDIGNVRGKVTVVGWDQPQAKLEGTLGAGSALAIAAALLLSGCGGSSEVGELKPPKPESREIIPGVIAGEPFIDVDEMRQHPRLHRYIHGGFKDTHLRFSVYLPPKELYKERFLLVLEGGQGGMDKMMSVGPNPDGTYSWKWAFDTAFDDNREIPTWVDHVLKRAVHTDPYKRYDTLSEFTFDLRHPSEKYLRSAAAPLIERNPLLFWKGLCLAFAVVIVLLLIALHAHRH